MMVLAQASGPEYQKVAALTEKLIGESPKIVQESALSVLQRNKWWIGEADRHGNNGFYGVGEFLLLNLLNSVHLDGGELDKAERRLEELLVRKRWLDLYDGVARAAQLDGRKLGPASLTDGTYVEVINGLHSSIQEAGIEKLAKVSYDILLPRSILGKMNYPFSTLRGVSIPPSPEDLRVLYDWRTDFRACFEDSYLSELDRRREHSSCDRTELLLLDLVDYGRYVSSSATLNGTARSITLAVKQREMHKGEWLYKAQKARKYFSGRSPMLRDPQELYNAARRAIRHEHSRLKELARETGSEFRTFPPVINP